MNDIKARLKFPAIGLIAVGVVNFVTGIVLILGRLVSLVRGPERVISDEAERLGYMIAGIYFPMTGLLSLAAAPVVIFGGIQMLSARKYSLAVLAAILALVPLSSVCCITGIPIGIWALIVLRHPEVRAAFEGSPMPA